jgi:hypothetical protein
MWDALKRAERCRDLAKECRRLAAISSSTDIRDRYLRMAEHYSSLAKGEEAADTGVPG